MFLRDFFLYSLYFKRHDLHFHFVEYTVQCKFPEGWRKLFVCAERLFVFFTLTICPYVIF